MKDGNEKARYHIMSDSYRIFGCYFWREIDMFVARGRLHQHLVDLVQRLAKSPCLLRAYARTCVYPFVPLDFSCPYSLRAIITPKMGILSWRLSLIEPKKLNSDLHRVTSEFLRKKRREHILRQIPPMIHSLCLKTRTIRKIQIKWTSEEVYDKPFNTIYNH